MRRLNGTALAVGLVLGLGSLALAQDVVGGPAEAAAEAVPETKPKAKPVDVDKLLDSTRIKAEFFETPLKDVCAYLSEIMSIDILLDPDALTDVNVSADNPITLSITK